MWPLKSSINYSIKCNEGLIFIIILYKKTANIQPSFIHCLYFFSFSFISVKQFNSFIWFYVHKTGMERLISCLQQEEHYYLIMLWYTERPQSSWKFGEKPARSNRCYWLEVMGNINSKLKNEQSGGKMKNCSKIVFVYLCSVNRTVT